MTAPDGSQRCSAASCLLRQRGHAWLLQGPSGIGQYELALALASAWLCEQPTPTARLRPVRQLPCHRGAHPYRPVRADARGRHAGTRLAARRKGAGRHRRQEAQGQPRDPRRGDARRGRASPSAPARAGRGKVVLVYPAERMNNITANALLKTLEEPVGRRALRAGQRSRVAVAAHHSQPLPGLHAAVARNRRGRSLAGRSRACRPPMRRPVARRRRPAQRRLAAARGRPRPRPGRCCPRPWPAATWRAGRPCAGPGRRIAAEALPRPDGRRQRRRTPLLRGGRPAAAPSRLALARWSKSLASAARTAEHPFNAGLMLEALVSEARTALNSPLAAHEPTPRPCNPAPPPPSVIQLAIKEKARCTRRTSRCLRRAASSFRPRATTGWATTSTCC
jgi:DNA polymerase-3 subunit delta'